MPTSVSKHLPRHNGTIKTIGLDERPICKNCKNPIKIVSHYYDQYELFSKNISVG